MAVPRLTRAQLELVVASLRGQSVAGVRYALLGGDEPLAWDHGASHEPTHGCELTMATGTTFTFTWGNTFGWYGLEVFHRPIEDFLVHIGEEGGPVVLPVGGHPHWRRLIGRKITAVELEWGEWSTGDVIPCRLRLDVDSDGQPGDTPESLWITVGRWERGGFLFFTDDVTVLFDRSEAARAGIVV